MANEDYELYDPNLKKLRQRGASRRESLQPIVYKGGIPSAENARPGGITAASIANLLAPQDFSGTGATGRSDEAIQNSRRIKHDRQVMQLLSTLGGQQQQEEAATARNALDNLTKSNVESSSNQSAQDIAKLGRVADLDKQRLIGEQGLAEQSRSQQGALDLLKQKASIEEGLKEREAQEREASAAVQDERTLTRENQARAFELFKSGDVRGAERLARSGSFTPSYEGLTPLSSSDELKFIPGQKSSVKGIETVLPGKIFNPRTGDVQTDLSDLSPEERDALLKILENRETQGLK